MHLLTLVAFLALAAAAFFALRGLADADRLEKESDLASLSASLQQILSSKKELEKDILLLSSSLSRTLKMYETARDICATLDESRLFVRFKDDLKELMDYDQCVVLKEDGSALLGELSGRDMAVALSVQDAYFGTLLVKGVADADRPFLGILARHFALGLKRSRLYQMTQELAITDSLTGLYTRRYAIERLKEELKRSDAQEAPLSFMMIDADNFKECNDRYGHLVGDMVLTEISRHIKENIREVDMLARFGGEEFMVFAPKAVKRGALAVAERIRRSIEEAVVRAYDERLRVTVSIGLASYPDDAANLEDLVGKADWALYQAKKLGKNRTYVFGSFRESG